MPIVAGMGGNAGSQTMTVTVRALATKDIDIYNAGRIIRRELGVGFLNGAIFAVLIGLVAGLWFQDPNLGGIIAAAMVINMMAAALAGILIPLVLDRFGRRSGRGVVRLRHHSDRCRRVFSPFSALRHGGSGCSERAGQSEAQAQSNLTFT